MKEKNEKNEFLIIGDFHLVKDQIKRYKQETSAGYKFEI